MNYLISILLIIIIIIFGFLKINYKNENFEDSNILDMYVITLGKKERIANIKNQEKKINNKIQIFDAVNGSKLDINDLINNNILANENTLSENYNHKMGEIGCYLSHLNIYKKIKENNKKGYTIIFEDDFLINSDDLINEVKKTIDTLDSKNIDFDFLFLGNLKDNHGENIANNLYYIDKNVNLYGTHGYVINNKNIDKIIDKINKIESPIDNTIQNLSYNNVFNTIVIYPNLVIQEGEFKSTIRSD
jgi:GR25 family glycosyltransferase involved in LPS biosynthesis